MSIEVDIEKRLGDAFRLRVAFRTGDACLGILGPSGCGKSMTLKCVAGVETPDRGRIVVNGRTVFDSEAGVDVPPQRRRVGYLFQNYALFPRMTTAQNIAAGMTLDAAGKRRAVADLVREFHLDGLENRYPDQLSGGQRQRVALARMLAAKPEAILLDEPFAALDSGLREYMRMRFREMIAGRRDAILVTHDRDEAYSLCGDIMILDRGKALAAGPTGDVFANPGSARVAALTGCENLSRLERLDARRMRAVAWDLLLDAEKSIPDDADTVGVRAHDIEPAAGPDERNAVRLRIRACSEEPSGRTVVFSNADAGPDGRGEIWWRMGGGGTREAPEYARIPPGALVFLRDDGNTEFC